MGWNVDGGHDSSIWREWADRPSEACKVLIRGLDGLTPRTVKVDSSGRLEVSVTGSGGSSDVQYTEGDVDTSITGTAVMWEDAGDTLRAVSAAKPLPVGDAGGSLTVDGTVAATQSGAWTVAATQSGGWTVSVSGSVTVTATNLDIRDLSSAQDSVAAVQSGAWTVAATQSGAWTVSVSGSVTVTATDLDIRNLSSGQDSVAAVQSGVWTVAATQSGSWSVSITGTVTVDTELTTKDYDTGVGTDTVAVVGILLPASGGAVAGGTSTNPIRTDPTGTTTQPVGGNVAHDAADSGSPLKAGGKAVSTVPTSVASGDRVDAYFDVTGRQVLALGYHGPMKALSDTVANGDGTGNAEIVPAPASGNKTIIYSVAVTTDDTSLRKVSLKDGTTTLWVVNCAAEGGGAVLTIPEGMPLTAATAFNAAVSATVTSGKVIDVAVTYKTVAV